nr:unnamed protein product [Digitaria exilis]
MHPSHTHKASPAGEPLLLMVSESSSSLKRKRNDGSAGPSVSGAVFNVSTSIVGAGIMSIPAAMRVLGVIPCVLLIAAVAALANSSVEFLLRYTRCSGGSYAGVMGDAFGRAGAVVLNVCVVFTTMGTLIVYLIIIGDVMSGSAVGKDAHVGGAAGGLARALAGDDGEAQLRPAAVRLPAWCLARAARLAACRGLARALAGEAADGEAPTRLAATAGDSLRYTSAVSILLAVVFIIISLGIAVYTIFTGTVNMPRMFPDFSRLSSPFELFTAVPVIVVAFTFHFNVHPIRAELKSSSDMKAAVRISLVLCSAIYVLVGFFGFLLFGEATMADVLVNFDRSSGAGVPQALNDLARLSYALHLVLVFPLLNFSLRINVDELLFQGKRSPLATDTPRFMFLTAALMVLLYALAIVIPSIWTLIQYGGSVFPVSLSLIFPGAIVLRDIDGTAKKKDKAVALTMIMLAVISSSIAITANIMSSNRN